MNNPLSKILFYKSTPHNNHHKYLNFKISFFLYLIYVENLAEERDGFKSYIFNKC